MLFFLAVVFFITTINGSVAFQARIVGGEPTTIEAHPYIVSIESEGYHRCGASIISEYYVLTAAHCFNAKYNLDNVVIRAGSTYKHQKGSLHHVEKLVRHENAASNIRGNLYNDVAVIKVKEPFVFDATRQPIRMFDSGEKAEAGVEATISGWGETRDYGLGLPVTRPPFWRDQLQTVVVPVVDEETCSKAYEKYGGLKAGQICGGYYGVGGKDACQADSGGPMVIDGRLAGIVSWGYGCAKAYYPGVYTEVAYFRDWIDRHVQH